MNSPPDQEASTQRELELLARIKALEDDRLKFLDIVRTKLQKSEKELEVSVDIEKTAFSCKMKGKILCRFINTDKNERKSMFGGEKQRIGK